MEQDERAAAANNALAQAAADIVNAERSERTHAAQQRAKAEPKVAEPKVCPCVLRPCPCPSPCAPKRARPVCVCTTTLRDMTRASPAHACMHKHKRHDHFGRPLHGRLYTLVAPLSLLDSRCSTLFALGSGLGLSSRLQVLKGFLTCSS
jgi:hypothetical protein